MYAFICQRLFSINEHPHAPLLLLITGLDAGAFKTRSLSVSSQSLNMGDDKEIKTSDTQPSTYPDAASTCLKSRLSDSIVDEGEDDSYHDDETAPLNKDDHDGSEAQKYRPKLHNQEEIEELKCRLNPSAKLDFDAIERQNARDFVQCLLTWLPKALACTNTIQVDEQMQKFASDFCSGVYINHVNSIIIYTVIFCCTTQVVQNFIEGNASTKLILFCLELLIVHC